MSVAPSSSTSGFEFDNAANDIQIQQATSTYVAKAHPPIRKVADAFRVLYSTIHTRMAGCHSRATARGL